MNDLDPQTVAHGPQVSNAHNDIAVSAEKPQQQNWISFCKKS